MDWAGYRKHFYFPLQSLYSRFKKVEDFFYKSKLNLSKACNSII